MQMRTKSLRQSCCYHVDTVASNGYDSVCDPLCCKACAVRPVFGQVVGKLGQQIQEFARRAMKANARQGHTLRLLDEAREVGRHQHPGPENQDSQHMIDQPRGLSLK